MLDLDPDTRITVNDALAHPYLQNYSDPNDEPTSEPLDQTYEDQNNDIPTWKSKLKKKFQVAMGSH